MYSQAQFLNLTVDEYFRLELESIVRHEYIDGQIYPMLGISDKSRIITENIFNLIRSQLYGSDFRVFSSEMKLRIEPLNIFYYPEILVTSDSQDREKLFKSRPCLIVEVISPTTERIDRNEKLVNYRALESLQEYVLVSQSEIKIDIYRKYNQASWFVESITDKRVIKFNSIGLSVSMEEIYEDVEF